MNGDNYSSRDSGRYGSSRDHQPSRRDRDDRRDRGDPRDSRGSRRRSRSPPDYRSGGRSRRDEGAGGGDVDAYSSSRSHRDREREDRYTGGRDRRGGDRGDREWDRDRGGRSRRDDDDGRRERRPERPERPERDVIDDRRGGGRRGGDRDADRERERERRRSASPPPKKREPTPDLTDIVPILERRRRLTQWDIKPPGYDNVTAEQAKLSGMFPLPGAPRQQAMDPTKLQAFMSQPGGAVNSAALKPTNSRQAKRLILSNIPRAATDDSIVSFFNLQLNGLNVIDQTDPCLLCNISPDRTFAMLEFRNNTDATVALALDGITMDADDHHANGNGTAAAGLKIRRPKDYIVPAIVEDPNYDPDSDVPSSNVVDGPNKISVTNIPPYLTEDQVMELLVSFGKLKSFVFVKDNGTQEPRGIAFLEYADSGVTDVAISGLNNMMLGEKALKVQKASIGITQVAGELSVNAMSMLAGTTPSDNDAGRVLQLLNMVTADELMDNDDYEEIRDDVQEECEKFGKIISLKIPRPVGGSRQSAGVGKIFIKFENHEAANKALRALAGRKFADRTVVTTYFPEENFDVNAW